MSIVDRLTEANLRMQAALAERGFTFTGMQRASDGSLMAVAINGDKILVHIGRDEADAKARLATLAVRP